MLQIQQGILGSTSGMLRNTILRWSDSTSAMSTAACYRLLDYTRAARGRTFFEMELPVLQHPQAWRLDLLEELSERRLREAAASGSQTLQPVRG
jgi:hypothetical protein